MIEIENLSKAFRVAKRKKGVNVNEFLYHLTMNMFTSSDHESVYHNGEFDHEFVYH